MLKIAVVTISDSVSRGQRESISDKVIAETVKSIGIVNSHITIPDELDTIAECLRDLADSGNVDIILTTGGTGLSPRDVTPEATYKVIDREIAGIAEKMRMETSKYSPNAILSRAVAGTRKDTLIINLPGSPKAVKECLEAILPVLVHAVDVIKGRVVRCGG
ncbi:MULTISPECIES: MogA/MoaB family molybdenum cofactor biosynthesis protein [Acetivibrio]|jgi:molybdenum cofactor synthesis domain-containing protein|uniref:MogA/MoaB family molybdenum cofactor biosynthesis protein n=1 Tax=Acetivibrio TaxID=35829 RepID=UPI00223FA01B|nr:MULTISPECIES: MogA/MoaB family molybdenum cofactor biosynthesis protein [Acetivibrio]HOM02683.1 MogA/MoaB family molybdenum cofactor biosynthesis protein [Acetivibrio sp.]HOV25725.1 MogA/MoaB family molybdenum cofactor biosynthesis protein [Pseudobacteroides sp.]